MSKPCILIVDDEDIVRDALYQWFTARGFEADVAVDGFDAVRKCDERAYDVVTMDVEMPRMNGIEAMEIIRKKYPDMPILVLTGYVQSCYERGLPRESRVLTKPVPLRDLETEVRALIGQQAV